MPFAKDCQRCPRLRHYLATLPPRRGLTRDDYWSAPVPGYGDPAARVLLVGLAPGAHGANRTGRPFTGDGAGDFMYPLLHQAGFASQPTVVAADDGLLLRDLFISNAVRCAPPDNKPTPVEFANCRPYLQQDVAALPNLRVVLALGREAFLSCLRLFQQQGAIKTLADYPFGHGARHLLPGGVLLLASYHTSRYNVQTGRINAQMFLQVLTEAKEWAVGKK
jgi:uracil-DNA glycosylase